MAGGFPSGIDRPGNEQPASTMNRSQPGILGELPTHSRYLSFALSPGIDPRPALAGLRGLIEGDGAVVAVGSPLVSALAVEIPGLRDFPVHSGAAVAVPSTPAALWCWLRGEDPGVLLHRSREIRAALSPAFRLESTIDAFEALLARMVGAEDGVVDALFRFTRPVSGSYYWCPPMVSGRLNLTALGI